jgi:hypothetical protein
LVEYCRRLVEKLKRKRETKRKREREAVDFLKRRRKVLVDN